MNALLVSYCIPLLLPKSITWGSNCFIYLWLFKICMIVLNYFERPLFKGVENVFSFYEAIFTVSLAWYVDVIYMTWKRKLEKKKGTN